MACGHVSLASGADLLNLYGKLPWAGLLCPLAKVGGGGLMALPVLAQPFPAASHPWLSRLSFVASEGCSRCGVLPRGFRGDSEAGGAQKTAANSRLSRSMDPVAGQPPLPV